MASQTHSDETWVSSGSAGWLVEVGWTNRKHGPDYIQSWSHEVNTSKTGWQEEWDSSSENKNRMTIPFMKKRKLGSRFIQVRPSHRPTDLSSRIWVWPYVKIKLSKRSFDPNPTGSIVERLKPAGGHPRIMRKGYGWLLPGIYTYENPMNIRGITVPFRWIIYIYICKYAGLPAPENLKT